jgi:hypothetical protein
MHLSEAKEKITAIEPLLSEHSFVDYDDTK